MKSNKDSKKRITNDLNKIIEKYSLQNYIRNLKVNCLYEEELNILTHRYEIFFEISQIAKIKLFQGYCYNQYHHKGMQKSLLINGCKIYDKLYDNDNDEELFIQIINEDDKNIISNICIKLQNPEFKKCLKDIIQLI